MKKNIIYALASVALMLVASCQKTPVINNGEEGFLSFSEFSLELDETVETKAATEAGANYSITILDAEENVVMTRTYGEVKNGTAISLPAGQYTLVASSYGQDIPEAVFDQPIYGVSKSFAITAGETTPIGSLTCTLVQCKVTVAYSEEFLATVTGEGSTTVTVTSGFPLVYNLPADGKYDQRAGYFAVSGSTMEVVFNGSIEGKSQKMTKVFNNIAAKQWRQIKFVKKTNEQGDATFDIVINDLIDDTTLNNSVEADKEEGTIGTDPLAPKDDGGIKLILDEGCDPSITYVETDIVTDPVTGDQINSTGLIDIPITSAPISIKLKAVVPGVIQKFTVDITTDNEGFAAAVAAADATHLDLISPSETNMIIFEVVPFPYADQLVGKTEVPFDISAAQEAIVKFPGNHLFTMTIVDANGKKKICKVTMRVA